MPVKLHPIDFQPVTIVTLVAFAGTTIMESGFQMHFLLYGLHHADAAGTFSLEGAAQSIAHFYQLRMQAGHSPEKQQSKAENYTATRLRRTLLDQPLPIFKRFFLLSYDESSECLAFPSSLWEYLKSHPVEMTQVRALALSRLATHYAPKARLDTQTRLDVEAWVKTSLESDGE